MKYAISACLMGENCKYSGGNNYDERIVSFMKDKEYICICPEVLGGLPTPRPCCEIVKDRVMSVCGEDCTQAFYEGAQIAFEKIKKEQVDMVILQPRSPSCGIGIIYDGSFTQQRTAGDGVFVQVLKGKGIPAMHVDEFLNSYNK